jgi:mannose-6-phosphate isomerase-like protein (cupin superfamily)
MEMRRVVVGDEDGAAVVTSDTRVEARRVDAFRGAEFFLLWGADEIPSLPSDGPVAVEAWIPGTHGARFGISVLPPKYGARVSFDEEALVEIEQVLPGLASTLDLARPGMHTTDTIDFVLVLKGSITLELQGGGRVDLEAGDSVVQCGTPHAWRNTGDGACVLAIAMIGAERRRAP